MPDSTPTVATQRALDNRQLSKAAQVLSGIITGISADGHLHDLEIQMLSTWLTAHPEVAQSWPGSAVARLVEEVLDDGAVTEDERTYLLCNLQKLFGEDFANTGSADPEVAGLPFDEDSTAPLRDATICLTGEFAYGTRSACQRLAEKHGCTAVAAVSKKVQFLIVGAHVSPNWVNTSYGLKIQRAMELREEGHSIGILSEERWLALLS